MHEKSEHHRLELDTHDSSLPLEFVFQQIRARIHENVLVSEFKFNTCIVTSSNDREFEMYVFPFGW